MSIPPLDHLTPMTEKDLSSTCTFFKGTLFLDQFGLPVVYRPPTGDEFHPVSLTQITYPTDAEDAETFQLDTSLFTVFSMEPDPTLIWVAVLPKYENGVVVGKGILISGGGIPEVYNQGSADTLVSYLSGYSEINKADMTWSYLPDGTTRYYEGDEFIVTVDTNTPGENDGSVFTLCVATVDDSFTRGEFNTALQKYPTYWGAEAAVGDLVYRFFTRGHIAVAYSTPVLHVKESHRGGFSINDTKERGNELIFIDMTPSYIVNDTPETLIRGLIDRVRNNALTNPIESRADRIALVNKIQQEGWNKIYHSLIWQVVTLFWRKAYNELGLNDDGSFPENWSWERKV